MKQARKVGSVNPDPVQPSLWNVKKATVGTAVMGNRKRLAIGKLQKVPKTLPMRVLPTALVLMAVLLAVSGWWALRPSQPAFLKLAPYTRTVILDAGHGGEDGGAKSPSGIFESGINLAVAQKSDALLRFYGIQTQMVRTEDISIHDTEAKTIAQKKRSDLSNRVKLVNGVNNALLVSIHQNTFTESKYFGAQVFYGHHGDGQPLAMVLQETFRVLDPANTRQAKQVADTVYLMNHATCPAVLVECGFLTNPDDEQKLLTEDYQRKIAMVILSSYLEWENLDGEI